MDFKMIIGPMLSGKTSTALLRIKRWKEKGGKIICFVPEGTNRETRPLISEARFLPWKKNIENDKGQQTLPLVVSGKELEKRLKDIKLDANLLVVVDEIQFFDKSIVPVLKKYKDKTNFLLVGLDKNYTSRIFETTHAAAKVAGIHNVFFTHNSCFYCGNKGEYYEKRPGTKEGVGDEEIYRPTCFVCLHIEPKTLRW